MSQSSGRAAGRSLEVPGVTHGKVPIPMGARVGPMIFSSGIAGKDPATDTLPADPAAQVRFAFANMKALVEAGGGSLAGIGKVTVFIKNDSLRGAVNEEWLRYFPDPHDRPARHTLLIDLQLGMLVQLEVFAVVGAMVGSALG